MTTNLERIAQSVIEAVNEKDPMPYEYASYKYADKLARACLVMHEALKAILATENQDCWNPHKLLLAFRHNEHEARDALSKVEEIMEETNEGYVCNHCGVPTGNYQLCDKCAFKILEKIKMKGPG